jgi:fatty-acyl-CoA synthase
VLHLGTTGNPKGVLYSHRSTVLHAYGGGAARRAGLSARDTVLPVVPMFHVNAWGLPYSARMVGAKLVFPGPALDGKSLYELFEPKGVTFCGRRAHGVAGLLQHVKEQRPEVLHPAAHGDRRLGLPAGDDPRFDDYGVRCCMPGA